MATTPTCLSGAAAILKIDSIDMHSFGMIVDQVINPVPRARAAVMAIPGKSGDYDFTKVYESRAITISGVIVGDTHTQLMSNLDELKNWLRLRMNSETLEVIFQDQTDRYWTCRYEGEFSLNPVDAWKICLNVNFILVLKCIKPYAEGTSLNTENITLTSQSHADINYSGGIPAPITIKAFTKYRKNILEEQGGDLNDDYSLWTTSGCSGGSGGVSLYNTHSPVFQQDTLATPFYLEYDVTSGIDTSKYYVFGLTLRPFSTNSIEDLYLRIIQNGAGGNKEAAFEDDTGTGGNSNYQTQWIKISPSDLSGATSIKFRLECDDDDSTSPCYPAIDAGFIYEITSSEYNDTDFVPAPFISDPTGDDWVGLQDLKLRILHNKNIFPEGHGNNATNWTNDVTNNTIGSIDDPLELGEKSIMIWHQNSIHSTGNYYSPYFAVKPGQTLKSMFKYYCDVHTGGNITVKIYWYHERTGFQLKDIDTLLTISSTNSSYTEETDSVTVPNGAFKARLVFIPDAYNYRLFIKNIMFYYDTSTLSYSKYDKEEIEFSNLLLDKYDVLTYDADKFSAHVIDASADPPLISAMQYLSGDRLRLFSGNNVLQMDDSRVDGDASISSDSLGRVELTVTYRNRYL